MDADRTVTLAKAQPEAKKRATLRVGEYFWRPWYAKAWWIAIPLYWLPAGTPLGRFLEPYYASSYGAVTNILFTPLTAAAILGFRYLRRALASGELLTHWYNEDVDAYRSGRLPPSMDENDPRSEYFWIHSHKPDSWRH